MLRVVAVVICCILVPVSLRASVGDVEYLSPLPGAGMVRKETNIVVRWRGETRVLPGELRGVFCVQGTSTGAHEGRTVVSDDGETILFQPLVPFAPGEAVKVDVRRPGQQRFSWTFRISDRQAMSVPAHQIGCCAPPDVASFPSPQRKSSPARISKSFASAAGGPLPVSTPSDFPFVSVSLSNSPAPGRIFINNWGGTPYLMILENDGTPVFYRRMPSYARDFKVQPTGVLTYRLGDGIDSFFAMDSGYTVIDTFQCGNGLGTDEHELEMLPTGHVLMIGLDFQTIDMSAVVPGGNRNATVVGNVVQELDTEGRVVFEWRSWDHFQITDCVNVDLTAAWIDYVHMNSIDVDSDGNILISSRHLSEVTKINRQTGAVMWRLGGKNNMFTFLNDPYGISYQHDARSHGNGRYTIFDNGNHHSPPFSRAVEYSIDTLAMTATLLWQYRHSPDRFTGWMGNAQRLPNGNTVIGWADGSLPKMTEVRPDGSSVYELDFANPAHCYRVFRLPWTGKAAVPYLVVETHPERTTLLMNKFEDESVVRFRIYAGTSPHPTTVLDSSSSAAHDLRGLQDGVRYYFRVTSLDTAGHESGFSNEESAVVRSISPGQNMLLNGDFSEGQLYWTLGLYDGASASGSVTADGEYSLGIGVGGPQVWSVQLVQTGCGLVQGKEYLYEFDASAASTRTIDTKVEQGSSPWANYSSTGTTALTNTTRRFSFPFTMTAPTDQNARVVFNCGKSDVAVLIDNVSLRELLPNGVGDDMNRIPFSYELRSAYPNPFNPNTIIQYDLPVQSHVRIIVYNLLGQAVGEVVDAQQDAGTHEAHFTAAGLASGCYIYRMEALPQEGGKKFTASQRFLLVK